LFTFSIQSKADTGWLVQMAILTQAGNIIPIR